tara:strand:- start:646 stop:1401 length:756 start_codon:yes stop_codon:yes gene_type:complete
MMINNIVWYLKKIYKKIRGVSGSKDTLEYRDYLYQELIDLYGKEYFNNKRILEIGPRDGEDSIRLEGFSPSEFVLIDLPDKEEINKQWLGDLKSNHKFIQANFLYMSQEDYESLGKFDLIYFTGVLYHNPEQLRFIQKIYDKLNFDGVVVLESATTRKKKLINENVVEIHYPNTYRDTTTVSHLPSKKAILSWLEMVGFKEIFISKCYEQENYNVKDIRFACIAKKTKEDVPSSYYEKQLKEQSFIIGKST